MAPAPPDARSLQGLNALTREKTGADLYESYEQDGDTLTIQLNSRLWNRLSAGEQRQLCDLLARGTFMQEMKIHTVRLYVVSTHVGDIDRIGDDQRFSPQLQSLR